MRAAWSIAAGSIVSALLVIAVSGRQTAREVMLGMAAPLCAVVVSWVLTERTYTKDPARLTGLMLSAFVAKMVFFGAYVAVMLSVMKLQPVPFVASFTGYFIALYLIEALLMRRLFAR